MSENGKIIDNRYDFVYLFEVRDGNPNGDPDAGNQPRIDPENGNGLITDVCLKRKVRNFVSLAMRDDNGQPLAGYDIYVKERGILANEQKRAYQALGLEPGDRPSEAARKWMCTSFFDIRAFGAVMTTGKTEDPEAKKAPKAKAAKSQESAEVGAAAGNDQGAEDATADASGAGKRGKQKLRQWNCGQVRGPVQLSFARSIIPILSLEHAITRCALTNAGDTGRESAGDDEKAATLQMGRKMTIPYGLYRAHGFISPHFAADTGFSGADLSLLWKALVQMFNHDHSATRCEMAARRLFVFKHSSKLGNAPAHVLFERINVEPKKGVTVARSLGDYTVSLAKTELPKGVELIEYDCDVFADTPLVVPGSERST